MGINQAMKLANQIFCFDPTKYAKKDVEWYYGPTGVVKTRSAWEDMVAYLQEKGLGIEHAYRMPIQQKDSIWFDGYFGQKVVLMEELRPGVIPYATLLQLLDGYEVVAPKKGGFVRWNPEKIWITSCFKPEEIYPVLNQLDNIAQLKRRITHVTHFVVLKEE